MKTTRSRIRGLRSAGAAKSGRSLSRLAYDRLRDAIGSGQLKPGERISVNALSDIMEMSRTPISEAVGWLESDGLVAHGSSQTRVIARLDHQMINELYAMRTLLETYGAAMAAHNASEADIAVLREMLKQEKSLLGNPVERERHNREFHLALHSSAHNRYLISSLSALQTPMLLLGPATAIDPERLQSAYAEHIELVDAIAARDAERAAAVIREHLARGQRVRIKKILAGPSR